MALISTSALRKITIAILAVAFLSFGTAEVHKRLQTSVTPQPRRQETSPTNSNSEASWQTYETPQFLIKYPEGWGLELGQEEDHSFDLIPPTGDGQLYQEISLYLGRNTLNLSALKWAQLDFADKEADLISFKEVPVQETNGVLVKNEKENKLRIYISDGEEKMYIFFLKGRVLTPKAEDKFEEIVSTFKLKK